MEIARIQKMYDDLEAANIECAFIVNGDSREIEHHRLNALTLKMNHHLSFEGAF
jgi:hypothetical protein